MAKQYSEQELRDMGMDDVQISAILSTYESEKKSENEQVEDKQEVFFPAYDPEKSPQENARIRKEYMEKCKNA